jgi:hypothetical protein
MVLKTLFGEECIGLNIYRNLARLAVGWLAYGNIRKADDKQLEMKSVATVSSIA